MIALSKIVKKIQCVVPLITPNYHFILHALIDNMKFMIETVFLCGIMLPSYLNIVS